MENKSSFLNDSFVFDDNSILNDSSSLNKQFLAPFVQEMILKVNGGVLLILAAAGIPTNVLNMKIYRKLGLDTSINISFLALSATDFICACIFSFVVGIILLDKSGAVNIGVDLTDLLYAMGGLIVSMSTLNSCITALISVERCCSVAFPLKVKFIFTTKLTIGLITGMLLTQVVAMAINLAMFDLSAIFLANSTGTVKAGIDVGFNSTALLYVNFGAVGVPSLISFCLIVVSTVYLGVSLMQRNRWMQSVQNRTHPTIARNRKLAVTVFSISTIYIACFLPGVILGIFKLFISDKSAEADQQNFDHVLISFFLAMQALSGTSNILVYLRMNSAFRQHLKSMLCAPCAQLHARVVSNLGRE